MKLSVLLLVLPLVTVLAAEKPAPKKTKASAAEKTAAAEAKQQRPKVVIPPGFGPRVGASQQQPGPAKSAAPQPEARPSARITPPRNPAPAVTIPAGAEEISPNVFRHTDAEGTKWLYSKTPFGVSKTREEEAPKERPAGKAPASNKSPFGVSRVEETGSARSATTPVADTDVTAKDLGDRVQFERSTPFGASRWERKKSELTEEEQAIWNREQKRSGSTADRAAEARP